MKRIARENIKLDDKQLNKEVAKGMKNPYYFTDRALKIGFHITPQSNHINHTRTKIIIKRNIPEFGIELRYFNKIVKELSVIFVRLLNQYKFKYQTVFSARYYKQDEDNQVLDEPEFFINLNINHNLTETDIDNIGNKSPLEQQTQNQELKTSGWIFDKVNTMTISFYVFTKLMTRMVPLMLNFR